LSTLSDDGINAGMNKEAAERLYLSEAQIVDDIFENMSPADRKTWLRVKSKRELISGHHTTGRSIRNRYLLWSPHNPVTDITDPQSDKFPDQVSQRIIEAIWTRCKREKRTVKA
jgi:hypothetical protein